MTVLNEEKIESSLPLCGRRRVFQKLHNKLELKESLVLARTGAFFLFTIYTGIPYSCKACVAGLFLVSKRAFEKVNCGP